MPAESISKNRLESFSDCVIAVIITIMVLELKVPHQVSLNSLTELLPVVTSYILSFVVVALLWINHYYLIQNLNILYHSLFSLIDQRHI